MTENIFLLFPDDNATVSFLTDEQKRFLTDPYRFLFHKPELEPRKTDLTQPRSVLFRWKTKSAGSELQISSSRDFSDPLRFRGNGSAEVTDLLHGKTYCWRVCAGTETSEIRTFTVAEEFPRWIDMPEVTNVRDIGGWKTGNGETIRQGMIFRGAQFEPWTNQRGRSALNEAGIRVFLDVLKIRTELDLRSDGKPDRIPGIRRYEKIPINAYASWGGEGVFSESQRENVRRIFQLFADRTAYPIYFHCQGGGDRTGTIAFLLEAMLGLERETLLTEYELSNLSVSGERSRFSEVWTGFMEKLRSFSPCGTEGEQVREFLRQCGIADPVQAQIRSILLEAPFSEKKR